MMSGAVAGLRRKAGLCNDWRAFPRSPGVK